MIAKWGYCQQEKVKRKVLNVKMS